ncbi:MAG: SusC/RagA family TonB-linked outer membrane protein [Bacteroidetes bacterium]|nr:SusC/RagA family TonB-linked outer membrane protein [Bacteroidota bacterium]MBS1974447.1 SusC/RagA family TonB-linked outer membrane protein [Bacteroidota bacterium]
MRKFLTLFAVLVCCSIPAFSQTRQITGRVTDQQGQPVPYATIHIKGSKAGVFADENGFFTIKAKQGDVLVVSSTGIKNNEAQIGSENTVNISVSRNEATLQEVVVTTALGIKRNRNTLPYSAQQISGDDLNKSAVTMNPVSNLSGKISGLQITQENSMGGSTNVILRGIKSLTQSNQALFVIDGVPYDNANQSQGGYDLGNAASDLNPDDIESVSVLKGAAASALYGSRASNGVVMITTKKGNKKKGLGVVASFGATIGSFDNSTLPTYQTEYGEGYAGSLGFSTYPTFFSATPVPVVETPNDAATGPAYDPTQMVYNWQSFMPGDPNYGKATPWQPAAHHNPTDFYVKPVTTSTSIYVNGSSDKGLYKIGYTHDADNDFIPNSSLKKNLISFSATHKILDNLSVGGAIEYSDNAAINRYIYPYGSYGGQLGSMADFRQWWPTNINIQQLKTDYFNSHTNATWNWQIPAYTANTSLSQIGISSIKTTPAYHDNPYWFVYKNYESDSRTRYFGNVHVDWKVNSFLTAMARVAKDYYSQRMELRQDIGSTYTPYYYRYDGQFDETNYDLMLNLNKNIGESINLKALLGGNVRQTTSQNINEATSGGLVVPGFFALSNSVKTPPAPSEYYGQKEVDGLYAGATLGYKELLTLDATLRRDQSSTLPKKNNAYYYPSVSLNFQFSQLLKSLDWLSHGKVWGNYAEVGGDAPIFSTANTYVAQTPINGQTMFSTPSTNNNPNLVPERQKSWETGIEASFLNERIGFNVTYYHARQINQIMPASVSTSTGFSTFYVNGGTVQNSGVEIGVNLIPLRTRDFSWEMNINWSTNKQKVLSLYNNQPLYDVSDYQNSVRLVAEPGKPYQLQGTAYTYLNGQRLIDSSNGYPVLKPGQYNDLGTPNPDWIGGINNTLRYKNIALSFLIDMSHGGKVYSLDMDYGSFSGLYPRTAGKNSTGGEVRGSLSSGGGYIFKGVTADGKPNSTRVDESSLDNGAWTFGSLSGAESHQEFVYDASYIKLRELAIVYSIPGKTFEKGASFIKGIDIALTGRNLWIIHKNIPYADPEQGQASGNASIGFQNGSYPSIRTVGGSVKFKF